MESMYVSEMRSSKMAPLLLLFSLLLLLTPFPVHSSFDCSSAASCGALVGYVTPNSTTIGAVKSMFAVEKLRSLLGANNLPLNTSSDYTLAAKSVVKVPFKCVCGNGTGRPQTPPIYTVVAEDGLYHIAAEVFSGLVTYPQIQTFNGIKDADLIKPGQKLKIPLPCSCDEVDGERVVHYGHVVAPNSTVEGIAQEFGTSRDTLLKINGLPSDKDLKADVTIDVPLKACTSMIGNNSLDYPFLVSNGTYAFTAADCVLCKCDAAINWTLQCQPSNIKSSQWETCPAITCAASSGCNSTSCAYAGYTKDTILATTFDSTCTDSQKKNDALKLGLQGLSTSFFLVFIHFWLLCHLID